MDAIGDGTDYVRREHVPGYLSMPHSNSIDVARELQRQVSHVQDIALPHAGFGEQRRSLRAKNMLGKLAREFIMARRNRRVCCKDAQAAHAVDVQLLHAACKALTEASFQQ